MNQPLELFHLLQLKLLIQNQLPIPPSPVPGSHPSLCLYESDYSRYLIYMETSSICPFVFGLLHLA
jgi:hypothetical protein